MRSLSLLALFVLVVHTTALLPLLSSILNRSLSYNPWPQPHPINNSRNARDSATVDELMQNGGRYLLKAWNGKYLAARTHKCYTFHKSLNEDKYWYIERINDNEIALRSSQGRYIKHDLLGTSGIASEAREWEFLTPVKNGDGSFSFTSRWNKWLSAHREDNGKWFSFDRPYVVEFMPANMRCEHWKLETW